MQALCSASRNVDNEERKRRADELKRAFSDAAAEDGGDVPVRELKPSRASVARSAALRDRPATPPPQQQSLAREPAAAGAATGSGAAGPAHGAGGGGARGDGYAAGGGAVPSTLASAAALGTGVGAGGSSPAAYVRADWLARGMARPPIDPGDRRVGAAHGVHYAGGVSGNGNGSSLAGTGPVAGSRTPPTGGEVPRATAAPAPPVAPPAGPRIPPGGGAGGDAAGAAAGTAARPYTRPVQGVGPGQGSRGTAAATPGGSGVRGGTFGSLRPPQPAPQQPAPQQSVQQAWQAGQQQRQQQPQPQSQPPASGNGPSPRQQAPARPPPSSPAPPHGPYAAGVGPSGAAAAATPRPAPGPQAEPAAGAAPGPGQEAPSAAGASGSGRPAAASASFLGAGSERRGGAYGDRQLNKDVRLSPEEKARLQAAFGATGKGVKQYRMPQWQFYRPEGFNEQDPYFTSLHPAALAWLQRDRGLSREVIRANRLFCTTLQLHPGQQPQQQPAQPPPPTRAGAAAPQGQGQQGAGAAAAPPPPPARRSTSLALGIPFFREPGPAARPVFVKYRLFDPEAERPFGKKDFRSSPGCEPIMFGLNHILPGGHSPCGYTDIIIVEGEMDAMAIQTAGLWNVVSVPNGAPPARPPRPDAAPQQIFSRSGDPEEGFARSTAHYAYLTSFCDALAAAAAAAGVGGRGGAGGGAALRRYRFTLATDADVAGRALRLELMRRLQRERCWEVTSWDNPDLVAQEEARAAAGGTPPLLPAAGGTGTAGSAYGPPSATTAAAAAVDAAALAEAKRLAGFRKDANEVLLLDGPAALLERLQEAAPTRVTGLVSFQEHAMEITALFSRTDPLALGVSTGWPSLDPFYRVAPGEVTLVTGVPNSGKSEWLDALMVNLAENHGWAFCVASMEKELLGHLKALIEKRARKPFRDYEKSTPTGRELVFGMSVLEMRAALNWVADHFFPLRYAEVDDTAAPSIDWILNMARTAVLRHGVRGLLVDPYNELDSSRPRDMNETEFIKDLMTKLRRFARDTDCHVWFVAHPRQQRTAAGGGGGGGGVPGMYDISGSAHWFNKTDNGIVVHRRFDVRTDPASGKSYRVALPQVDIKVQKVRNKDIGTQGEATLEYDRPTGRYSDPELLQLLAAGPDYRGPLRGWQADAVEMRNRALDYWPDLPALRLQGGAGADDAIDVPPDTSGGGGDGGDDTEGGPRGYLRGPRGGGPAGAPGGDAGNGAGMPGPYPPSPGGNGTGRGDGAPPPQQYQPQSQPRQRSPASAQRAAAADGAAVSSRAAPVGRGRGGGAKAGRADKESTKAAQLAAMRERQAAAAAGSSAPASGGGTGATGATGAAQQLVRQRDVAQPPRGHDMGWQLQEEAGYDEDEDEDEDEGDGGVAARPARRPAAAAARGADDGRVYVEVNGRWVPKEPEVLDDLSYTLLATEGSLRGE